LSANGKLGMPRYDRIVVKISGESLAGDSPCEPGPCIMRHDIEHHRRSRALDPGRMHSVAQMIASIRTMGVGVTAVVGGGNIYRGSNAVDWRIERYQADLAGMAATAVNVLLLEGVLNTLGIPTAVFSRGPCVGVGREYAGSAPLREAIQEDAVVLVAGGLGVPHISTDVAAVQAAIDTNAPAVIMSKHGVSGVYSAHPSEPGSYLMPSLAASDALRLGLAVMDSMALRLAIEYGKVIHVIAAKDIDGPRDILEGKDIGSVVSPT
jgi:uridylate kinase